jgi:WD40 repeat protein
MAGVRLKPLPGHRGGFGTRTVAWSADERIVVSGGIGPMVHVIDIHSGQRLRTLLGHQKWVLGLAMSADGRVAASCGDADGYIRIWDVSSGRGLGLLEGHQGAAKSVALSPDGARLLSGGCDGTVRLWDLEDRECLRTLEGHVDSVESVVFTADGQYALSAGVDKTVRVWDLDAGRCLAKLWGHSEPIRCLAVSADGRSVVTGSNDGTIRLWELDWEWHVPELADCDPCAAPYLQTFLTLHCSVGPDGISRVGKPKWVEDDFQKLLKQLQYSGFGWLRPEGVKRELEKMAAEWQGPPPLPWEK